MTNRVQSGQRLGKYRLIKRLGAGSIRMYPLPQVANLSGGRACQEARSGSYLHEHTQNRVSRYRTSLLHGSILRIVENGGVWYPLAGGACQFTTRRIPMAHPVNDT